MSVRKCVMTVINDIGVDALVSVLFMACMPSLFGMFVYKDDTSMVTSVAFSGISRSFVLLMKSVVSFTYDGTYFL